MPKILTRRSAPASGSAIAVLGEFALSDPAGRPLVVSSRKNRALLGILAVSPQLSESRARLASLLWSDRDDLHARGSLRQALAALRSDLGGLAAEILTITEDRIALRSENLRVDGRDFLAHAASDRADMLQQAASLYRGALLAGIDLHDPAFEDWLTTHRAGFAETAIRVLDRLSQLQTGAAQIATAQRLLTLDPLREASHRALMHAYANEGENGLALRQYDICAKMLRHDLDVEPAAETRDLRQSIALRLPGESHLEPRPRSERPAIAVLPFTDTAGDSGQQYLGDGLAQDLTVELTRYRSLFVIGSPSAFSVRDYASDFAAVSRKLKTQYLVTGGFRWSGNEIRLNIQLLNAQTGQAVWADRFHGTAEELAAFQDEVVLKIATRVEVQIVSHERTLLEARPKRNWRAYDFVLRGRYALSQYDIETAGDYFAQALSVDPQIADAHAYLALQLVAQGWATGNTGGIRIATSHARRAVQCDSNNAVAHVAMAYVCQYGGELDAAGSHYQRALELNPNDSRTLNYTGLWHCYMGDPRRGIAMMNRALERDPYPNPGIWSMRANTLYQLGEYRETIACIDRMTLPPLWDIPYMVAALARLGDASSLRRLRTSYGEQLASDYEALVRHAEQEPYLLKRHKDHLLHGLSLARDCVAARNVV